jgi:hypothetical protein
MPVSQLSAWNTKRLLGRLSALRGLEECPEQSDMGEKEASAWCGDKIGFKSDDRWMEAYLNLKSLLATREHIQ